MSADNWTYCPRCKANHDIEVKTKLDYANERYGKIPLHEWLALDQETKAFAEKEFKPTLREDYQLGIYKGKFTVDYSACCDECGFTHDFNISQEVQ